MNGAEYQNINVSKLAYIPPRLYIMDILKIQAQILWPSPLSLVMRSLNLKRVPSTQCSLMDWTINAEPHR